MIDRLKIIISSLVILGFVGVFGWVFYTTWTKGRGIAQAQEQASITERDRADALRRYEEAKRDAASAKENKDAHERDVKTRADKLAELTDKAAEAGAALAAARSIFSDNINYLATALAGLIGTVVATMFGQELGEKKMEIPTETQAAQTLGAAADLVSDVNGWRNKLSTIYAITYFLFGAIAIATWAFAQYSPEMVKNLATISLTLLLAIARSFFG